MKISYIKTSKQFKQDSINEGIIGDLWKKVKKGISLSISKKIGGASKVDKAMAQYSQTISNIIDKKIKAEGESISKKLAQEKSNDPELKLAYEESKKATIKQISLLNKQQEAEKNKFDINMKDIVGDNKLVQDYFNLKKVELASEMISKELESYEKLGGGDINDPEWQNKLKERQKQLSEFRKKATDLGKSLEKRSSEEKESSQKLDSEGKEVLLDINVGSKYLYPSESEQKDIEIEVIDLQDNKNSKTEEEGQKLIKVKTERGTEIEVKKSQLKKLKIEEEEESTKSGEKNFKGGEKVTYIKKDGTENNGIIKDDQSEAGKNEVIVTTDNNKEGVHILKDKIK